MPFAVYEKAQNFYTALQQRLRRATAALDEAGVPYAVIGGNAVMSWVARADETALRHTEDVDLLLDADHLERAKQAMESAGFVYRHAAGIDMFLDGPSGKARNAVHVIFAGRKVRQEYALPAPEISEVERAPAEFSVLTLEALVRMKLTSFRLKDQVHLQDLISVGLVDQSWPAKYPSPLRERLQQVLDNPEA